MSDELKMMNLLSFPCNCLPLKFGRPVSFIDGEIVATTWLEVNTGSFNSGLNVNQKRLMQTSVDSKMPDPEYVRIKKEYEQNRKNHSADKRAGIKSKRDKVTKANSNNLVNSIGQVTLHVLNNGCPGTVPSVALRCGQRTFLFNCGEGTQLALLEGSKFLKHIDYMLIGSNDYERFAGFAPMMLTTEVWGTCQITAVGSPFFE